MAVVARPAPAGAAVDHAYQPLAVDRHGQRAADAHVVERRSRVLGQDDHRLVACVPRGSAPHPITLAQLAAGPLVLREPGSMTRLMLERALAAHGLVAKVRLEVGSREAAREAVAAGIGTGVVLDGELGEDNRLAAVPIQGRPIGGGVDAVALPESLALPTVAAFMDAGWMARSLPSGPAPAR